jgi:hypothetical protein
MLKIKQEVKFIDDLTFTHFSLLTIQKLDFL